ncbi:hypothetical protein SASPL_108258 [Salvia splendens]|uniref:Plant heme peroxidase family profile domain-containing protein n=1 Tax=Salvia splendens TaxID=180675 RepID=A0A8X9A7A1_SALSN|nr:hypothetical protein SASPL_108258 [Salvia splendens]
MPHRCAMQRETDVNPFHESVLLCHQLVPRRYMPLSMCSRRASPSPPDRRSTPQSGVSSSTPMRWGGGDCTMEVVAPGIGQNYHFDYNLTTAESDSSTVEAGLSALAAVATTRPTRKDLIPCSVAALEHFIILTLLYLCSLSASADNEGLSMNFYRDSCPQAEEIIKEQVQLLYKRHKNTALSWLRNNCSCDASLLLDSTRRVMSEKEADSYRATMRLISC